MTRLLVLSTVAALALATGALAGNTSSNSSSNSSNGVHTRVDTIVTDDEGGSRSYERRTYRRTYRRDRPPRASTASGGSSRTTISRASGLAHTGLILGCAQAAPSRAMHHPRLCE
jgi:hypothetical protein